MNYGEFMKKIKQNLIVITFIFIFFICIQFIVSICFNKKIYADMATPSVATSSNSNAWNEASLLIEYYGNEGEGEKDGLKWKEHPYQTKQKGNHTYHYENNFFKRYGYIFKGWNTREDGSGISVMPGEEDINLRKIGLLAPRYFRHDNLTLYAQWEYKEWIVEFRDYDGNIVSRQSIPNGGSAIIPSSPLDASTSRGEYRFVNWDRSSINITQDTVINGVYDFRAASVNTSIGNDTSNIVQNINQRNDVDTVQNQESNNINDNAVIEAGDNKTDGMFFSANISNRSRNSSRTNMTAKSSKENEESEDGNIDDNESEESILEDIDNNSANDTKAQAKKTITGSIIENPQIINNNWFISTFTKIDRWMDNIVSFIFKNQRTFALSLFILLCAIPILLFMIFNKRKETKELEVKTPEGLIGYCYHSNNITGKSKVRLNIDNKTIKRTYTTSTLAFLKKET
jgi:hypothetical protein